MKEWFDKFSSKAASWAGSHWAFLIASLSVIIWALTGFYFDFSTSWQIVINTGTTIITFLMVFLIQGSQNRDTKALHLKMDAIIKGQDNVDNKLIAIEKTTSKEIEEATKNLKKDIDKR